jgi:hypothetical protein
MEEARRFVADLAGVLTLAADPSRPYPAAAETLATTISSRSREQLLSMRS